MYIKLFKATECCCLIFTACKHIYKEARSRGCGPYSAYKITGPYGRYVR